MRFLWYFLFFLVTVPGHFALSQTKSHLRPFRSDGCSAPMGLADIWTDCCIRHDVAYWMGGSLKEKDQADAQLMHCLRTKGTSGEIAADIFKKVPKQISESRWNSAWQPRRPNKPLSPEELNEVKKHQQTFTLPMPVVDSSDLRCSEEIIAGLRLIARLPLKPRLTCFEMKKQTAVNTTGEELVYSSSCPAGYFIVQKGGAFQDPNFVVAYGDCKNDLFHPEKNLAHWQNLKCRMFHPLSQDFYNLVRSKEQ